MQEPQALRDMQARLQLLQQYLVSYSEWGVPVFNTSLIDMKTTLNKLHDYLLQCIAIQMSVET